MLIPKLPWQPLGQLLLGQAFAALSRLIVMATTKSRRPRRLESQTHPPWSFVDSTLPPLAIAVEGCVVLLGEKTLSARRPILKSGPT